MSQQAYNEAYDDEAELAMDLAAAVNEEVRDLFAAGADIVQIDEPWLQSRAEKAREFALPAIDRALAGVAGTTALHTCFGYATSSTTARPAIRSWPSSPAARPTCWRSRPRSRGSTPRCSSRSPARP